MDKQFLRTLSDLELVKLQNKARAVNDKELVNDILAVLGEREKRKSSKPEKRYQLCYINEAGETVRLPGLVEKEQRDIAAAALEKSPNKDFKFWFEVANE